MATLNEVSAKITEVDAKQDKEIAVLTHKVDDLQKTIDDLRNRIRKNERWIAGAAAITSAAITVIGIAIAADARPAHALVDDSLIGTPCATSQLSSIFVEEVSIKPKEKINGRNGSTQQEVLLQLSSYRNQSCC